MGNGGTAMAETSDSRLIEMVRAEGFSFGPVIMAEARREGVELATALALVQQESGFRNIFGCDLGHRKTVPWCHQHVTRDRVQALIAHVHAGNISNGVGLTQLTNIGLIEQAEAEGGAHTVDAQCRIGFRHLHGLIERHGELTGIGCYNGGEADPNFGYADDVMALRGEWRARINRALGGGAPSGDAAVHRDLMLTTPFTEGPDVRVLQRAINARARELPYTDSRLRRDGQFGPHTLRASGRVAFALGIADEAIAAIKAGRLEQLTQRLIRNPSRLSADDRRRAADREPALKRRYEAQRAGGRAAVRWARSKIGVHEKPPTSNWGHPVQDWIKFSGFNFAVKWCGCFVAFAVVKKGGADVPDRKRLTLDTAINADIDAGRNGFARAVSVDDARRGDIATFDFRHIALVAGPTRNGMIHTIDGNTSASDGSNNNGGEVAEHRRPVSMVTRVGRLHY